MQLQSVSFIDFIFRYYKKRFLQLKRKLSKYRYGCNLLLFFAIVVIVTLLVLKSAIFGVKTKTIIHKESHKIDWHNWKQIKEEALRVGIGEQGEGSFLRSYPPSTKQINDTHGYNGYLSDKIALNRSLKDLRPKE